MEDKTTKIPSLKEFQKAQQNTTRKGDTRKVRIPDNVAKRAAEKVNGSDIHRDKVGRPGRLTPKFDEDVKIREPKRSSKNSSSKVSADTRKIDKNKINEAEDRFKAFEDNTTLKRRTADSSRPLTQTRVAGQRPSHSRPAGHHPSDERPTAQRHTPGRTDGHRSSYERPAHSGHKSQSGHNSSPSRAGYPQQSKGTRPPQNTKNMKHAPQSGGNAVRHKKKKKPMSPLMRKVRRIMLYVLVVLAFLAVGVIVCMTVLFKTENIVVNVPDRYFSTQEIIEASGLNYQDNIFMANKRKAAERLEEKFPYIKSADVYAVMPDTINIDITLSTPSYAVKTDKLTYIANEDSKVLEVVATADEAGVPLIEGVTVNNAKAGEHLEFESVLVKDSLNEMFNLAKTKGYKNITRVDIETRTNSAGVTTMEIRYVYDNRIVVYMGIPENITYKMQTAQTIIAEKLDVNGAVLTGELDVSNSFDTKKSYFNQYSLIPEVAATEPSSISATTAPVTEGETLGYDDGYGDDGYSDEGYVDDGDYYDSEEPYEGEENVDGEEYYPDEEVAYEGDENYADSEY